MISKTPVIVEISRLHPDGYGVSSDGRTAVLGSLPEETVIAIPFARRRKRTFARIESIEVASVDRVTPACSVANICGGCSFQHMKNSTQIAHKQAQWLNQFVSPPENLLPPLLGPRTNYRSKARLGVRYVEKKSRVLVGFREKMSGFITDTNVCKIMRQPVDELITPLSEMLLGLSDPRVVPQIEVAVGDDAVALVFRHLQPFTDADLSSLEGFAQQHNIQIYLQPTEPDPIIRLYPTEVDSLLFYDLPDQQLRMFFEPLDFTQINHVINRSLVNQVLQLLNPSETDAVLDAFSGIGNFSLSLARQARQVIGVESSSASVRRAMFNAAANDINNATFLQRDLYKDSVRDLLQQATHLVLDPPRSGAEMLVKTLADSNVKRVVYVSCNPQTLARDAQILVDEGYRFENAGVIDMFPHTTHVESIAQFSR